MKLLLLGATGLVGSPDTKTRPLQSRIFGSDCADTETVGPE